MLGTLVTSKYPLNPVLPTPAIFLVLNAFLIRTRSFTLNLCGNSVETVTIEPVLPSLLIPAITFGLRLELTVVSTFFSSTVLDS